MTTTYNFHDLGTPAVPGYETISASTHNYHFKKHTMKRETKLQELERRIKQLESVPKLSFSLGQHQCVSDGLQYLSYPPKWKCAVCGKFYLYGTPGQAGSFPGMPYSTC